MQQTSDNSCSLIFSICSFYLGMAMHHPEEKKCKKKKMFLIHNREKDSWLFRLQTFLIQLHLISKSHQGDNCDSMEPHPSLMLLQRMITNFSWHDRESQDVPTPFKQHASSMINTEGWIRKHLKSYHQSIFAGYNHAGHPHAKGSKTKTFLETIKKKKKKNSKTHIRFFCHVVIAKEPSRANCQAWL